MFSETFNVFSLKLKNPKYSMAISSLQKRTAKKLKILITIDNTSTVVGFSL